MTRLNRVFLGAMLACPAWAAPAWADPADWTLAPWQSFIGNAQLDIGATAGGAIFPTSQPGQQQASGNIKFNPRLQRVYDSGLSIGFEATLAVSDALSRGRYGGDFFEKAYGEIRTGLGRVQLGQVEGAAFATAIGGPKVSTAVSLDDPQTSFFRDPNTGRAFADMFAVRTAVGSTSNYAKLSYVSPDILGAQLAVSFTPSQGKNLLPFLSAGPDVPGRQTAMWEAGMRYALDLEPVTLTASAGLAEGRDENGLAGQEGISDLGLGLRADYPISDTLFFSIGGAWRRTNAYAYDIAQSWRTGGTRAAHVSAILTDNVWTVGVEYGRSVTDAVAAMPRLSLNGYQASIGYRMSPGIQITAGWQRQDYTRSVGTFFNASPRLDMDAAFLHLTFSTTN